MSATLRVAIIGSGHAAFGACIALAVNSKVKIDVFDIGLRSAFANQEDRPVANSKSIDGSYFPYGINDTRWPVKLQSERICSSHAYGGFSSVYSGAVITPRFRDLVHWPHESIPRQEDYGQVLDYFDILGAKDGENFYTLDTLQEPKLGVFKGLSQSQVVLAFSRIAVQALHSVSGLVPFKTSDVFDQLQLTGRINYKDATYVLSVEKAGGQFHIRTNSSGIDQLRSGYDAVFIGAGCINTTGIVHRSLRLDQTREYQLSNAAGFVQGYFGKGPKMTPDLQMRRDNNLPEIFLEVRDAAFDGHWAHTQISALNKHILETMAHKMPATLVKKLSKLAGNFYVALTGVPSILNQKTTMICSTSDTIGEMIQIDEPSQRSHPLKWNHAVQMAIKQRKSELRLNHIPGSEYFGNLLRGNNLGGWHFGGTIPMSESNEDLYTCSPRGEFRGIPGVFLIDSTAFPSIPGTTVALLTMGHAARVASHWLESHAN